jgi:beta-lactamase class D
VHPANRGLSPDSLRRMRKMDAVLGFVVTMMTVSCGATPTSVVSEADTATPPSELERRSVKEANGCAALEGIDATFVLYLPDSGELRVCDSARASQQFLPASTFKVANALIALETGVVADAYAKEAWDGVERGVPAWNQDTSLATGMANSTVWFYQRVAQLIGAQRMRERVRALEYGNATSDRTRTSRTSGSTARYASRRLSRSRSWIASVVTRCPCRSGASRWWPTS